MDVDEALKVTVGAGVLLEFPGAALTATATDCELVPPAPVQVKVKEVEAVKPVSVTVPEIGSLLVLLPLDPVQDTAPMDDQVKVTLPP
jgi:hypothetical protein